MPNDNQTVKSYIEGAMKWRGKMGKFGWSLPPGCGRLPGEDFCDDETRCARCHRDLDEAWEDFQQEEFDTLNPAPIHEESPMFEGFCCWACARDYADAEATKPYYAHEMERREEYRKLAAGAEAPKRLTEEEVFGPDCPDEPACGHCGGAGFIADWAVNPEDGTVTCPKCKGA